MLGLKRVHERARGWRDPLRRAVRAAPFATASGARRRRPVGVGGGAAAAGTAGGRVSQVPALRHRRRSATDSRGGRVRRHLRPDRGGECSVRGKDETRPARTHVRGEDGHRS